MFYPKILTTLKEYSWTQFLADLAAGVIVGVVAIPLAIAFGIASGVSPERGLITAIVAGFLISALGGSRVQIGGPTGAFVVIVYGIVQKYGVDGLIIATVIAGFILILMGVAKLGSVIKFIPHPVIVGFTSGIAVVIFSSEVKDFFGLDIGKVPADFVQKWALFISHFGTMNWNAAGIGAATVLVIAVWPKISRKIPGSLIALLAASFAVIYFHIPLETIGSRFGDLPHTLPKPVLPALSFTAVQNLMQPAITIALLGAIESLLSAVVSDGMIGGRHRSNTELIAQGIANIGSGAFGGIPATGAIARTVTNIKNGGRTPVAGIVHALTLLLVLFFFSQWVKLIPMAALAGILVVVSYNMSEWRSFVGILKSSRSEALVLLAVFFTTVFVDLTVGIELGMILSSFLFIQRMSALSNVQALGKEIREQTSDADSSPVNFPVPEGIEIYEINGPFFFGVAHQFEETVMTISKKPKVMILRLRNVPIIDVTGLHALKSFYQRNKSKNIRLFIAGLHAQPLNEMIKTELFDLIGKENVFAGIRDAVQAAQKIL